MRTAQRLLNIASIVALLLANSVAKSQDTIEEATLDEVQVVAARQPSALQSVDALQLLDADMLQQQGALQLSDALKHMPGFTLKDYGGIGGVKTVSMRGLGSQFTTLSIDGVAVSDNRNGQPDLSQFLVGNASYISASSSQPALSTARTAASASVIDMHSSTPVFFAHETANIGIGFDCGSFGLLSPSLLWEQRLGRRASLSLGGSHTASSGNYPFRQYLSTKNSGEHMQLVREHSASKLTTIDASLFFDHNTRHHFTLKSHFTDGATQLPGAVSLYNTAPGTEQTTQRTFFSQGKYTADLGDDITPQKTQLQVIGKYQYTNDTYTDSAIVAADGVLHNLYTQHEGYASAALCTSPTKWLTLNGAADGAVNTLHSNLAKNNDVLRFTGLALVGADAKLPRINANAKLVATASSETAKTDNATNGSNSYKNLSPSVGINLLPLRNSNLRLRYLFKETFRLPNFSELYFLTTSKYLEPERAMQHNAGITYIYGNDSSFVRCVEATADAYNNNVTNKIVAIPTYNMFVWSMINLGVVQITGLDLKCSVQAAMGDVDVQLSANYSYQQAIDVTDPTSKSYRHQIPYAPLHSGGATLHIATKWVDIDYDLIAVGQRYSARQNTPANRLDPYTDHGVALSHTFNLRLGTLRASARVLNLFDTQYEVVRNYPMMGRNFRISLLYKY